MGKLTRVKKYEALRNEIESQYDIEKMNTAPEDVLKTFDSQIVKKDLLKEQNPKHAKSESEVQTSFQDTFTNEYLDDFMREVREYNIRKGTRSIDSTEIDILTKISTLPNRTHKNVQTYVENQSRSDSAVEHKTNEEIVKDVEALFQETLQEDDKVDIACDKAERNDAEDTYIEDALKVIQETNDANGKVDTITINNEPKVKEPTFIQEEFKNENKQDTISSVEAELNQLSNGVETNNRLLNIALGVLIVALLAIIGFIVFTIYQAGGFSL